MLKLSELKTLHDKGLALLYLRPREKRPFQNKWTTGPRATWEELKRDFDPSYNVGVRLGEASQLENGYLMCLDVDIKDPKYKKEALTKLKEIIGDVEYPTVFSGSGNGSRHLYGVSKEPFKMLEIEKHKGKWEICAYSEGRQMCMPPSTHPNGNVYRQSSKRGFSDFPLFIPGRFNVHRKGREETQTDAGNFKAVDVDLYSFKLDVATIKKITEGRGVEDRSAELLSLAMKMCRAGFDDNQILSVLSDENNWIASAAYEHTQSRDRARAVKWLDKYTLQKARHETHAMRLFENAEDYSELPRLSVEKKEKLRESLSDEDTEKYEINGYYSRGEKGGLIPEYDALLKAFRRENEYRMLTDMKHIYVFRNTHYVDMNFYEVKAYAEKKFFPKPTDKIRAEFLYKVYANNTTRRHFFTESIEGKLNFKNGVLDLSEGQELKPHSPDYGFRGVLPYNYEPEAKCPFFKQWLLSIMMGDRELIALLQEFMGYIIRGGEYKYHKALWLGGVGRNGKSTFVDLLKALIGLGNFSVISIKALMSDKFIGAELDGKIANFSEETSPQELADSGPFKNLTGDGDLVAQKKFGDPYFFRNRAKLVMTYNQIPDLKDLSAGMLSRPVIIPFKKVIGESEQDRDIKQKLFKELPGIFNFALRGWQRLERNGGFTQSTESQAALNVLKEESCNAYQWVENHVQEVFGKTTPLKPYDLYTNYCTQERYAYKAPEFYRRIQAHPKIKNARKITETGTVYKGIKTV